MPFADYVIFTIMGAKTKGATYMMASTYALIRVSTKKQKVKRQIIKMEKLGIQKENITIEKESGKSTARIKYHKLVRRLKAGDTLYIENVDRLSRDYDGIINQWHKLTMQKGVIIKVLDTPMLDTDMANQSLLDRFIRNILLHVYAYLAEHEWEKSKSRQAQGIAVAKASGKNLGRPKKVRTKEEMDAAKQYLSHEIVLDTALAISGLKKSAFYSLCRAVNEGQN